MVLGVTGTTTATCTLYCNYRLPTAGGAEAEVAAVVVVVGSLTTPLLRYGPLLSRGNVLAPAAVAPYPW